MAKKTFRIADIAAFSMTNPFRFFKIIQIGKTNPDGTPVSREQEAIADIEAHTDIKVTFIDYEKYNSENGKTN